MSTMSRLLERKVTGFLGFILLISSGIALGIGEFWLAALWARVPLAVFLNRPVAWSDLYVLAPLALYWLTGGLAYATGLCEFWRAPDDTRVFSEIGRVLLSSIGWGLFFGFVPVAIFASTVVLGGLGTGALHHWAGVALPARGTLLCLSGSVAALSTVALLVPFLQTVYADLQDWS